jgi:hypothetical protein
MSKNQRLLVELTLMKMAHVNSVIRLENQVTTEPQIEEVKKKVK